MSITNDDNKSCKTENNIKKLIENAQENIIVKNNESDRKQQVKGRKKQENNEVFILFDDKSYFIKIKEIEEKLKNYIIENYDVDNEKISLKFIHTFNTKLASDKIVSSLNFDDRKKYLASIIALFHDYARFEQAKLYDSFNDLATIDHADLAVEMLFDKNEIINFVPDLTSNEQDIIRLAIKNHNKFAIESGLTEEQIVFCKIIRDADKIDIFRVITTNFKPKNVPRGHIEQSDLDSFYNHLLYKRKKEISFYSMVITNLSFIYDINFKKSYELILENDYINKYMYALLLSTPFKIEKEIINCFKYAMNYLKEKVKD